jgi:hypothetical protein
VTAFDPLGSLRVLTDHGVRFVVIGGIAGATHGSPSVTQDLDVCYERGEENLERLATALGSIHARLRGADHDLPFSLDAKTLEAGDHFTFITDLGDLDCLGIPAGTLGYDDLMKGAVNIDLEGLNVAVASIDDLIRMKRAAGRPRDLAELEILGALRDE